MGRGKLTQLCFYSFVKSIKKWCTIPTKYPVMGQNELSFFYSPPNQHFAFTLSISDARVIRSAFSDKIYCFRPPFVRRLWLSVSYYQRDGRKKEDSIGRIRARECTFVLTSPIFNTCADIYFPSFHLRQSSVVNNLLDGKSRSPVIGQICFQMLRGNTLDKNTNIKLLVER